MTQELKDKVNTLEATLQDFIKHTDRSFTKMNNAIIDLRNTMDDFKEEMQEFKQEMRTSREASTKEMQEFKQEMRTSREASAKEMQEFKQEMRTSREASAKEMQEFKKEMAHKWGALSNRLGTLSEDIVAPNIVPLAQKYFDCRGKPLDFMVRRVKTHAKELDRSREFDAIAVYADTVILSETKSTPRSEYVKDFSHTIKEFFDYFPEFAGRRLIPIFASLNVEENILKQATKNKIYVMALKGDTMDILNYNEVSPEG